MAAIEYGLRYWFNSLCKLFGEIRDDKGVAVVSYSLEKIPESVTKVPCAISFLEGNIDHSPSTGGPTMVTYHGKTEFHLTMGVQKNLLPYVLSFPDKILQKAASSITLGGKVVSFRLVTPGSIRPVTLSWGNEDEHFGLLVPWVVIENQSGKYTVSP